MASKKPEEERTKADIEWVELEIDGRNETVCSIKDARLYLDVSEPGLLKILNKHQITRYTRGFGSTKYVKKSDMDSLLKGRPATD